jgi:hypothetical protein
MATISNPSSMTGLKPQQALHHIQHQIVSQDDAVFKWCAFTVHRLIKLDGLKTTNEFLNVVRFRVP